MCLLFSPPLLLCVCTYVCVFCLEIRILARDILPEVESSQLLRPHHTIIKTSSLLFRRRTALRETLEPAERVVDKDPILEDLTLGRRMSGGKRCKNETKLHSNQKINFKVPLTDFQRHVRELVKVGRVVDGAHLDGDGRRPLADVLPVDAPEERHQLQVLDATLGTEPGKKQPMFINHAFRAVMIWIGLYDHVCHHGHFDVKLHNFNSSIGTHSKYTH